MIRLIKRFFNNRSGTVALAAGIMSPALLGVAALAFDYAYYRHHAGKLQAAADNAVLSATREMAIAGTTNRELKAIAKNAAVAYFFENQDASFNPAGFTVDTTIKRSKLELNVDIAFVWQPFFAHYLDSTVLPIRSNAVASLTNQHSICTLALRDRGAKVFRMNGDAELDARECAIHSNSSHRRGLFVNKNSRITSNAICTAGGYKGGLESFSDEPVTDCPALQDPISGKDFPTFGSCDHSNLIIKKQTRRLYPGVYCNGLKIRNKATVYFEPGTYIFVDGDLDASNNSKIIGDGVSLYFARDARIAVRNSVSMSLSAPKSGAMTGILLAAAPNNNPDKVFQVQSADARTFTGLIYTPNNTFKIGGDVDGDGNCEQIENAAGNLTNPDNPQDCETQLGSYSEWTAIIAKKIHITAGVQLVLNADYESSSVPVPPNDGALGSQARLVK